MSRSVIRSRSATPPELVASEASIPDQLAALQSMTVSQLQVRYQQVFGEQSRSGNRQWLLRRVAWRIQALAEGGLSERALSAASALLKFGREPTR